MIDVIGATEAVTVIARAEYEWYIFWCWLSQINLWILEIVVL